MPDHEAFPDKERESYLPAVHHNEEHRALSIPNGPSIAFTSDGVRVYDPDHDEFVELSTRELCEALAAVYDMED